MKRNTSIIKNSGFSLLEITVVLIIISILLSAVIPVFSRVYLEKAANKTALDISAIQEASRKFYIDNNQWPAATSLYSTPIAALQANGYLPSAWNAINPFGASASISATYSYNVTSNTSSLTVCTFVVNDAQNIVQNSLTTPYIDANGNVCSSIPVPGNVNTLPVGTIVSWAGSISTPQASPAGFLWCNGQAVSRMTYSGLFAVIGTTYGNGDGGSTFNLPNIMGRAIVGQDTMGGAGAVNTITNWGGSPYTLGGTFGEAAHRQSVSELAPHAHEEQGYGYGGGAHHPLRFSDSNQTGVSDGYAPTMSTGGNGDGSGLGAPSNVVQPSIALGYIIKY